MNQSNLEIQGVSRALGELGAMDGHVLRVRLQEADRLQYSLTIGTDRFRIKRNFQKIQALREARSRVHLDNRD